MLVAMDGIVDANGRIGRVPKMIDEIAFQTNILALNAVVEAAKAGEADAGFAVDADEVRSLAQRCAQASKDTANLVEESISAASTGKEKVHMVVATAGEIAASATTIGSMLMAARSRTAEQDESARRVSTSIGELNQVTRSAAASAEQNAAAAQQLSAQSKVIAGVTASLAAIVAG
jgi:methyl-accepting chemotaxis protein